MHAHRNVPGLNLHDCVERKRNGRWGLRRSGGLAVLVAAAIGLAACGSGSSTPQVASLKSSGTGSGNPAAAGSPAAAWPTGGPTPTGSPTQLMNEWAACMRSHGDPNQPDPTIAAGNQIHIIDPNDYSGTIYGPTRNNPSGAGVTCMAYVTAASTALRGGKPLPCMPGDPPSLMTNALCAKHANHDFPGDIGIYGSDGVQIELIF